jgi:glycogen(starch) synthase
MSDPANICFEVSFECGNKVGGIYTVLTSKSREMKKRYGKNYYTIGFFNPQTYFRDFVEETPPLHVKRIFRKLEEIGIKCRWGKWILAHDVRLILVDSREFMRRKTKEKFGDEEVVDENINLIKRRLWEDYKIDSLRAGFDYDEPVAWSTAAGMLIERFIRNENFKRRKIIAHFHEWLSGAGLLYLLKKRLPVGLVFTIHATRIGRAKSYAGENLMEEVSEGLRKGKRFDDKEAYKYNLEAQHMLEKVCANRADVFTTVSEIVSDEAEYILGKKPDIITPNSLDFEEFFTTETLTILHNKYRRVINEFLEAYFSPYYPVSMKDNVVFFISGRYEFLNKGVDLFIEALSVLNERLKRKKLRRNVFAFILIPSNVKGPKKEVLESFFQYQKIKSMVSEQFFEMKDEIINQILDGEKISFRRAVSRTFLAKAVAWSYFFSRFRGKNAPICAFELNYDENEDEIIKHLKKNKLLNKVDDKVRVIFYPTYLSPTDGLLGMEYQDFVIGTSMGVFPSRYEPWGYTPFETAALRVLSLTTDVAGFGSFIQEYSKKIGKKPFIKVLRVKDRRKDEIVKDLADILEECVFLEKEERMKAKIETRFLVEKLDWKYQIKNYLQAHSLALKKMKERIKQG